MQIPLNQVVLRLGELRLQSLSTFHRAVKKLEHFEGRFFLKNHYLEIYSWWVYESSRMSTSLIPAEGRLSDPAGVGKMIMSVIDR